MQISKQFACTSEWVFLVMGYISRNDIEHKRLQAKPHSQPKREIPQQAAYRGICDDGRNYVYFSFFLLILLETANSSVQMMRKEAVREPQKNM